MEIPDLPIYDGDLWGRFYRDCYEKGEAIYHIRRDDGYLDELNASGYFRTELSELESQALSNAKGHVLDVGCGVGASILWLQKQGIQVTGIDISPGAVEIARERGAKDARVMSLWDLPQIGEKFDTVIFVGNNTGLAGSLEKTGEMLDMLRDITNDDAVLICHSINPTATDNPAHLAYHKWNIERGRYKGQATIRTEYDGYTEPWFGLVLFEPDVFKSLCENHGWHPREMIGDNGYFLIADKAG